MVAATFAEIHRDRKKSSRPFVASDFLLFSEEDGEPEEMDTEELVQMFVTSFGAKDLRKKG